MRRGGCGSSVVRSESSLWESLAGIVNALDSNALLH